VSRQPEFEAVLAEIVDIARHERVDALLLAGDVFDTFAPPAEADRLLNETLLELATDGVQVAMIAGNHDGSGRFDAWAPLYRLGRIHVLGGVPASRQAARLALTSRDGRETAVITAVPWIPERSAVDFATLAQGVASSLQEYRQNLDAAFRGLGEAMDPRQINVFLAHVMVDNADVAEGGGERRLSVSQTFSVSPTSFPAGAQYVALGHVHKPQPVQGLADRAYYSGSPLQLDFGEAGQTKSVNLVEVRAGLPAQVSTIPLQKGRRLRKDIEFAWADLDTQRDQYGDDYLKVTVLLETPVTNLYDQVRQVLPNALEVTPRLTLANAAVEPRTERRGMAPDALFARYHEERNGAKPSPELLAAFHELYAEAEASQ
jgi:exonuclease SbcD